MRSLVYVLPFLLVALLPSSELRGQQSENKKRLLLIGQGHDGHPKATHEYTAGMRILASSLKHVPRIETRVVSADGQWLDGPELIKNSDGVVLFVSEGAKWIHADPRRLEAFAQLAARGGGMATIQWGMGTKDARYIEGFVKLFGGCHGGPDRKYKHLDARVTIAAPEHPALAGVGPFDVNEEFYYRLKFVDAPQSLKPLLRAQIDGRAETISWAWERPDGGRSFGFTGLHHHRNWELEPYRRLMTLSTLWIMKVAPPKDLSFELDQQAFQLPEERTQARQ